MAGHRAAAVLPRPSSVQVLQLFNEAQIVARIGCEQFRAHSSPEEEVLSDRRYLRGRLLPALWVLQRKPGPHGEPQHRVSPERRHNLHQLEPSARTDAVGELRTEQHDIGIVEVVVSHKPSSH